MLDSRNLLGTWWRVESTFVLLSYFLDEGTVVAANTYSESYSVVSVRLQAFETCLDLLDFGVYSQVVPQDQVDCVCGDSTPLSHKDPLTILIKSNV